MPYVIVSTFADWKAIADGYQQGVEKKSIVTPAVKSLAAEIVSGATTPREQIARLYDWVRANVRYVASYVGDGGWVPNNVDDILSKHYGDCKDHALLLETLLTARGIEASQVLIDLNTDNYVLPTIPVPSFNHAIIYVPSLDLFLDSTNELAPFGVLPQGDADKPVLIAKKLHGS